MLIIGVKMTPVTSGQCGWPLEAHNNICRFIIININIMSNHQAKQ